MRKAKDRESFVFGQFFFMDTKALLKKVRKIEIKTRGLSQHLFSGEYHSAFKGKGMSFSEVRAYQYGDDVRDIDWNVTARTGTPYVKLFEEERELTLMLLMDVSGSAFFGTGQGLRRELFTEIGATLAFSAIQNNDKVGIIFFSDRIEKFIPPKKGRSHILLIIREMLGLQPQGRGTDIGAALEFFHRVVKKRSIAFLLSDFLCEKSYERPLRIVARKHDLIGLRMYDPFERDLPAAGLLRVQHAETGDISWIDASSRAGREAFAKYFRDSRQRFETAFQKASADKLELSTEDSYVEALLRFFKRRVK